MAGEEDSSNPFVRPTQDLTSPVFRLPAELMLIVFKLFVRDPGNGHTPETVINPCPALSVLSIICWRFRELALESPSLWREIKYYTRTSRSMSLSLYQLRLYLERSRGMPLDVRYSIQYPNHTNIGDFPHAWNLIVPHLPRCHRLSVHVIMDAIWIFPIPSRLSCLKELDVSLYRPTETDDNPVVSLVTPEAECHLLSLSVDRSLSGMCKFRLAYILD